jgi:erythronate-4-phosphate dehydrogenase
MCAVEEIFGAIGDVSLVDGRAITSAQLQGVDVLLVRSVTRVDAELLQHHLLRFVGSATSGTDHVDRLALQERGIGFAWAGGSNADSVVDYVLSAICQCADKLEQLLSGGVLGIVGYGHIGRRLQRRLSALGISCKASDPWLSATEFPVLTSLEEVLDCDVVCLHAALTHDRPWPSHHLLGTRELQQLRPDSLLINAGRGELVDSEALYQHLRQEGAPSVILDVWEGEPRIDERLLALCQFGTAHIAGYSYDAKLLATQMLYHSLCSELDLACSESDQGSDTVPVTIPTGLAGAELIRWLLAQAYDIAEDDRLLRGAPASFDQLRKTYRKRRELSLLQPDNVAGMPAATQSLLRALGCRLG